MNYKRRVLALFQTIDENEAEAIRSFASARGWPVTVLLRRALIAYMGDDAKDFPLELPISVTSGRNKTKKITKGYR